MRIMHTVARLSVGRSSSAAAAVIRRVVVGYHYVFPSSTISAARTTITATKVTPQIRFLGTTTTTTKSTVVDNTAENKYENLVEEAIKKLIAANTINREDGGGGGDDNTTKIKPITDEELEARFKYFKKVFEEAEQCLSDLRDLTPLDDNYDEECDCAEGAVNNAFTACVDLLEDLRRSNEEQLRLYNDVRNTNAYNLKNLRNELDRIKSKAKEDSLEKDDR